MRRRQIYAAMAEREKAIVFANQEIVTARYAGPEIATIGPSPDVRVAEPEAVISPPSPVRPQLKLKDQKRG